MDLGEYSNTGLVRPDIIDDLQKAFDHIRSQGFTPDAIIYNDPHVDPGIQSVGEGLQNVKYNITKVDPSYCPQFSYPSLVRLAPKVIFEEVEANVEFRKPYPPEYKRGSVLNYGQ